MVEHLASRRFGEPDIGPDHGGYDGQRHADYGIRRVVLRHRGRLAASAGDHRRTRKELPLERRAPALDTMNAGGLSEFMAMGGYGFYVWTSYVVAAVAVAFEIVAVRARIRTAVKSALRPDRAASVAHDTQSSNV